MSLATLVGLLTVVVMAVAPISWGAVFYLWGLHRRDRKTDARIPKPLLRLSLVLAVIGTIASAAATYLATLALIRIFFPENVPLLQALTPITLTVFVVLDIIPLAFAIYLRSLRGRTFIEVFDGETQPDPDP